MAVVQTKSTAIANRDSSPVVINDARIERGTMKSSVGSAAVGAGDSINSYYPLVQIPSSAIVRAALLTTTAGMTGCAANIGVFKTTANSGGVTTGVSANGPANTSFGSATSLATALGRTDITAANIYDLVRREQPLWQAIGLSADPGGFFDMGVQLTAANAGAAGRVGLEIQYVDNGS